MKKTATLLKICLVGLFLALSTTLFGQVPSPAATIANFGNLDVGTFDDGAPPVTSMGDAVLFYNPATGGPSLTLTASLTDINNLEFTSYIWQEIDETGEIISDNPQVSNQFALSQLEPGYHRYRVYGLVDTDGVICQSDEFQDIVLFVLRPLAPVASAVSTIVDFCIDDIPEATSPLQLEATVDFGTPAYTGGFPNPDAEDFELTYRWYAMFTPFGSTDAPTEVELAATSAPVAGATRALSVAYDTFVASNGAGTYTFHVDVRYSSAIKDPGTREHALWTATLGGEDTPFELVVSPVPSRPTITIESVVD